MHQTGTWIYTLIKSSETFCFCKGNKLPFLKWNNPFWERKVFIHNIIRLRSATKPAFLVMKYLISYQSLVSCKFLAYNKHRIRGSISVPYPQSLHVLYSVYLVHPLVSYMFTFRVLWLSIHNSSKLFKGISNTRNQMQQTGTLACALIKKFWNVSFL